MYTHSMFRYNSSKYLQKKIPVLIITIALAFFAVNESYMFVYSFDKEKKSRYETNKKIFDNISEDHKQSVNILSAALALDPTVQEAYKKDDPEIIKEHILPIWNRLKAEKLVYEIHFFKPPAISFVNFSDFKSLGKDVKSVRTDIDWVTSTFKSSLHVMMCKTYPGFRATYPIIDNEHKMLGGLSMGKKIDWLPDAIKKRTGDEAFLVYTQKAAQVLGEKYYNAFLKNKVVVGELILAEQTIAISKESVASIDLEKDISELTLDGKEYIMNKYPIIDFNGKVMGYIFTLNDFQYYYTNFTNRVFYSFLIIFVASFLVYLIMSRKLQKMVKQADYISTVTQKLKQRDFRVLHNNRDIKLFQKGDVLKQINDDVYAMGETIEQKYKALENKLVMQLYTDELTQLPNRNALMRDLKRYPDSVIVLFNVRLFKQINDVFGFNVGNLILKKLAQKLKRYIDQEDIVAYRLGSDEFAYLYKEFHQEESLIVNQVENILDEISKEAIIIEDDLDINISLYAGISLEQNEQLATADMALMHAKKGQNSYVLYTEAEDTKEKQRENIAISKQIREALLHDAILPVYQPIVDAKTGELDKYEALVRMRSGDTLISPFFFLEISKKTQSYHAISKRMIQKSLQCFEHKKQSVSLNLSAFDILNDDTATFILQELANFPEPQRVVFELTETDEFYEMQKVRQFIDKLKTAGAKIAIDDFGTGYSNFAHLMDMEPDYLKIDGSLIKNLDQDEQARKVVTTIVQFSQEIGMKTIAEFVHNQEVMDICIELGVDELQGYHTGKPDILE